MQASSTAHLLARLRRLACGLALSGLASALACGPVRAQPAQADPWVACSQAAAAAERDAGLPPGLLLAIGKVESGRVNPLTGQVVPWPYAVNIGGRGVYADSAQAAASVVAAAQAGGALSIDVGCFQISLLHHPGAFATLADGFDPSRNGAYAARFLAGLRRGLPGWDLAAGAYHSGMPELAGPYAARVMSAWSGGDAAAPAAPAAAGAARAWAGDALDGGTQGGAQTGAARPGLVQAILFRTFAARRVRVVAPGAGTGGTWPAAAAGRARLPAVYSPGRN